MPRAKKPDFYDSGISQLIQDVHTHNVNYLAREIFITGQTGETFDDDPGVEYRSANTFIKNLSILEMLSQEPITIRMQIVGGSWECCMAMYDAMKTAKSYITLYAYAQASSASGILMQAADKRIMMPHTHFMLHYGYTGVVDTPALAASEAMRFSRRDCNKMVEIFAERAIEGPYFKQKGWPMSKIIRFFHKELQVKQDWYLTADKAVDFGFADEVFSGQ